MKLPRTKVFYYSIGLVIILVVAFVVGFKLELGEEFEPKAEPTSIPAVKPPFDEEKYTKEANVLPLGQDLESEDKNFRAQIKGRLEAWDGNLLKVEVNGEMHESIVPEELRFHCMPEFIKDQEGNDVKTSEVFVDLRNMENIAIIKDRDYIKNSILPGETITVQVTYDTESRATADLIMGYGCLIYH